MMQCPQCGRGPVTTNWKYESVPYDWPETKSVSALVPVRRCWHCDCEWTDWMADELREEAVKEARRNSQSK